MANICKATLSHFLPLCPLAYYPNQYLKKSSTFNLTRSFSCIRSLVSLVNKTSRKKFVFCCFCFFNTTSTSKQNKKTTSIPEIAISFEWLPKTSQAVELLRQKSEYLYSLDWSRKCGRLSKQVFITNLPSPRNTPPKYQQLGRLRGHPQENISGELWSWAFTLLLNYGCKLLKYLNLRSPYKVPILDAGRTIKFGIQISNK